MHLAERALALTGAIAFVIAATMAVERQGALSDIDVPGSKRIGSTDATTAEWHIAGYESAGTLQKEQ